jgi:transcriptional regulator with XRE-family HTH domain
MNDFDEKKIAERIKSFRLKSGMTLDQLASITGLTKGYLSRIENSEKSPPISTLSKIASAFHSEIISFLTDDDETQKDANLDIVRAGGRKVVVSKDASAGYIYESLAYRMPGKNMEPMLITLDDRSPKRRFQHEGEEFIFILEGRMEFFYEGKSHILETGDSAYFNGAIPHSGRSLGKGKALFLCVIYSYRRV